jgi:uncharacterized protein with HEPN domain
MSLIDDTARIQHIIDAAEKSLAFIQNHSRADLDTDEMLRLALMKLLEIAGEAASRTSLDVRTQHPEIPWRELISLRNRLTHGYFDVNLDILWHILQHDIPPLLSSLRMIIPISSLPK